MHEQTDMVKDLLALLDRRVGAPEEPFVDLEDCYGMVLGKLSQIQQFPE